MDDDGTNDDAEVESVGMEDAPIEEGRIGASVELVGDIGVEVTGASVNVRVGAAKDVGVVTDGCGVATGSELKETGVWVAPFVVGTGDITESIADLVSRQTFSKNACSSLVLFWEIGRAHV